MFVFTDDKALDPNSLESLLKARDAKRKRQTYRAKNVHTTRKTHTEVQLTGWLAGWLAGWPAGRLAGWPAGRLAGWPAGRLAGWPAGRLASWLAPALHFAASSLNALLLHTVTLKFRIMHTLSMRCSASLMFVNARVDSCQAHFLENVFRVPTMFICELIFHFDGRIRYR